jgi:uncharacterized protein YbjQ (UPF0145 family)
MKSSILISSTESIEGMKIEKYIDLISTNVVLGTNIFSDIGASFSDFFGGTSDIYQNKLEKIYKIGLDKLKRKAQNLSANGNDLRRGFTHMCNGFVHFVGLISRAI